MRVRSRAGRATTSLLVGAAVVAMVAGCSSSTPRSSGASASSTAGSSAWAQVVSSANSEGKVTLYSPTPQPLLDAWTSAFEKAYPKIKLSIYRASPGAIDAKLIADQQAGNATADVVIQPPEGGPQSHLAADETQGKLATLTGPNLADPDMKAAIESPDRFWVYAAIFGWAWNTQLLPKGIHNWSDLLNPDLASGKLAVWDPSVSPALPPYYPLAATASGNPNFLKDLAAQKPGIYQTTQAMDNAVASGEITAAMYSTNYALTLKAQGAPIDFAVPPNGVAVGALEAGILKSGPHPAAAQVLVNWLASEQAQQIVLATGTPARANVPGNPTEFSTVTPTPSDTAAQQTAFVAQFNALFRK
jgi:iron(III) transport system substrate-binding protein